MLLLERLYIGWWLVRWYIIARVCVGGIYNDLTGCVVLYVPYFPIKNVFIFFPIFLSSWKKFKKKIIRNRKIKGHRRLLSSYNWLIYIITCNNNQIFFLILFSAGYGLSRQVDLFFFFSFAVCSLKNENVNFLIFFYWRWRWWPLVNQKFSRRAKGGRWAKSMDSGRLVSSSTFRHRSVTGTWPTWWAIAVWWASPYCVAQFETKQTNGPTF